VLSDTTRQRIEELIGRYPERRSALIPALMTAQDQIGYLPPEAVAEVGRMFGMHPNEVLQVATFYSMLFKRPVGRHVLQVCTNISCLLRDSDTIVSHIGKRLGIRPGETTSDGRFTLMEVECLASCGTAPVLQLTNREYHENLTVEKLDSLIDGLD
jgi:NADH-quinone oxidoreductase E subunit